MIPLHLNDKDLEKLAQHIEALIFAAEKPIQIDEIHSCLEETLEAPVALPELQQQLDMLIARYQQADFALEIAEISGGYQFLTKGAYHQVVGTYLRQTTRKQLSRAALETLAIIAYKQPVPKSELEKIRGVSCDYSIQKLLEKELVTILGRSDGPGKPLLYGTGEKFMEYFGLKNIQDLPKPKEFKEPEDSVGEQAPIEENADESSDS